MSLGSTKSRFPPITPSITTKGDALAPTVEIPLSLSVNPPFGSPPGFVIDKPATLPSRRPIGLLTNPLLKSSSLRLVTALVISFLSCVP